MAIIAYFLQIIKDNFFYLFIIDNGFGMDKEELKIALGKFGVVQRNIKEDSIGLGLNLVQKLVEAHGGKFFIRSRKNKETITVTKLSIGYHETICKLQNEILATAH